MRSLKSNLQYIGRFERANKGTLFLDEISELSLPLQSKLLRALREREIERLGGTQPIKVDVRMFANIGVCTAAITQLLSIWRLTLGSENRCKTIVFGERISSELNSDRLRAS